MILVEFHDRFDPAITPTVEGAIGELFEFGGMRGEYSLYVNRQARSGQK